MYKNMTIHEKINFKMIGLLDHYLITKHPKLVKLIPSYLKGKARYNTCYDMPRPLIPTDMVTEYISQKSERVRNYLKHNSVNNKYLKVEIFPTPVGVRNTFSLIKEKPSDYQQIERTGAVRFLDVKDVDFK